MFLRFLPWRFLIKRAARAYGFIDPASILARLRRFSQPSEVQEPIELVRAGIIFQARGLINTRAIQFNMDWVWPYWVERQFNPADPSFVPRAFSATHVNLTQRNWTAVGLPDLPLYPLVDPRGLLTPLYNGWSLDFWIIPDQGEPLLPSRQAGVDQTYLHAPAPSVATVSEKQGLRLETAADMVMEDGFPEARVRIKGDSDRPARLCVSIRPYNPEGIQFIEKITANKSTGRVMVDGVTPVVFSPAPEKVRLSDYDRGDVFYLLDQESGQSETVCRVGLATGAVIFPLTPGRREEVEIRIPLGDELKREFPKAEVRTDSWESALQGAARLEIPDNRLKYIYDCAVKTLVHLSALDIFPGPFGYRRFWFRDACLMLNALLGLNMLDRAERIIDAFPSRQTRDGYFRSQEGEWDSNGQALWIMDRFKELSGRDLPASWLEAVTRGADWIIRKRLKNKAPDLVKGLLPAGFSAEHLGPNDYYYWDDFWGVAGLGAAARLARREQDSRRYEAEARDLLAAVFRSMDRRPEDLRRGDLGGAMPAAPGRRMDAGAIGSMVADWPLKLTGPNDQRASKTLEFILKNCFHRGGFFQDMIHSGINIYLTLALAQTLLRFNDARYRDLVETCADLASPTGQWPEAVHPFSGGGCMGDGQHGWAAAEWIMMMRSLFVREEDNLLVIGSGIFPEWLESGRPLFFGPTPTPHGPVSVSLTARAGGLEVELDLRPHRDPPAIEIRVPGYEAIRVAVPGDPIIIKRKQP